MLKTPFFGLIFFLILAIAFLHISAIKFYFYWSIWWYDLMMHFLGGFWIALVVLWFIFFSGYFQSIFKLNLKEQGFKFFLVMAVFSSLGVGIAWEIFELWGGITYLSYEYYWADTIGDLFMDGVGGVVASWYVYRVYKDKKEGSVNSVNSAESTNV